jgi:hypothetical protein
VLGLHQSHLCSQSWSVSTSRSSDLCTWWWMSEGSWYFCPPKSLKCETPQMLLMTYNETHNVCSHID